MTRTPFKATLLGTLLLLAGCDTQTAEHVQDRYAAERWMHRALLHRAKTGDASKARDLEHWTQVAGCYEQALETLPALEGRQRPTEALRVELHGLTNRATLGRIEALRRMQRHADALHLSHLLLEASELWPGTRGRAALEIARCHDAAGDWEAARAAYSDWCQGLLDGAWPLHRSELDVPGYVSRRLADRGQLSQRRAWVSLSSSALGAAAARDEWARDARYTRFLLLLDSEHWDAALQALRVTRQLHDPQNQDGGLVLAEANLLAGAMQQPQEAMGLLFGLQDEESGYAVQYRVAGFLMAGQIEMRRHDLETAQAHYERAAQLARSSLGRAEAALGLARVFAARGDVESASRHYTQLRNSWPATAAGLLASLEEYRMLQQAGMHIEAETVLSQAFDHYRVVIANFGSELPALRAAGYLSEVLGHAHTWNHGVAFLDSIANTFSEDPRAGSLLLRAARIAAYRLDDPARAQELLQRVQSRYPDSDLAVAIRPFADSLRNSAPGDNTLP